MGRLLHAAARGARIQYISMVGYVTAKNILPKVYGPEQWRIHPDDEHLQYGPISSALRELATTGNFPNTLTALMSREAMQYEMPVSLGGHDVENVAAFALILAEYFADQGM